MGRTNTIPDFDEEDLKQEAIVRAETILFHWYYTDKILDFEKDHLFSQFWQLACHESQIPEPGDMVTLEVAYNLKQGSGK